MTCTCPDLTAILAEVRTLKADFYRFKKVHKEFAARTTNEVDELFAKVDARVQVRPGRKRACAAKTAICPNSSVTLPRNHGNGVTLQMRGAGTAGKGPSTSSRTRRDSQTIRPSSSTRYPASHSHRPALPCSCQPKTSGQSCLRCGACKQNSTSFAHRSQKARNSIAAESQTSKKAKSSQLKRTEVECGKILFFVREVLLR
jgi:hypothetical protein